MASESTWKAATFALAGLLVGALATAGVMAYRQSAQTQTPTPIAAVPGPLPVETPTLPPPAPPGADPAATTDTQPLAAIPAEAPPSEPKPVPVHRAARSGSSQPAQRVATRPTAAQIQTCNRYATSTADKAKQTLGKAVVGGMIGAALGAAGGAIADGGSGAGKGAGIGGLVGAAAGTAYGINQSNQTDARAEAAYRECMQQRGYTAANY